MKNIQNRYRWLELSEDVRRQYVDAQSVLTAFETAKKSAAEVRGGMHWKAQRGAEYLIRTSVSNEQRSLGSRSPETEEIYNKFIKRKDQVESRLTDLKEELERQRKMNRALNVGRAPKILVDILNTLSKVGLAEYFIVIGTHSLYAYEAAAGVRIRESNAMTTRDIDLLWDTRKRLSFVTNMSAIGSTFLEVLQKVDSTFEIMPDQLYTAVNSKGFEIDIIRRPHTDDEPHPLRLTDHEDDNLP